MKTISEIRAESRLATVIADHQGIIPEYSVELLVYSVVEPFHYPRSNTMHPEPTLILLF